MKHVIRLIDAHSEDEGVLVDLDYFFQSERPVLLDLRIHYISNGTVGPLIDVEPLIKLQFAGYLLKFLETNKE